MKKTLLFVAMSCALSACQTQPQQPVVQQCPSCDPPTRHYEVVTECSAYKEKDLGNGSYAQCRYCTNKIYSNGVDVTAQFKGVVPAAATKTTSRRQASVPVNAKAAAHPCNQ